MLHQLPAPANAVELTWWDTHLSTMADGLAAIARTGPQGKRFAWDRAQALAAQAHYADLPRLLTERMHETRCPG